MNKPERVTTNPGANEQLLYFTSTSLASAKALMDK